jgi:serine acetyltransferase
MDFDFAHRRRWPGRSMSLVSCSWLLLSSPGLLLLLTYRIAQWCNSKRKASSRFAWFWYALALPVRLLKFVILLSTKSFLKAFQPEIEGGIFLSDDGYLILGVRRIGTGSVIGTRVTLGQDLNLGTPEIGRNVWIGYDCVVYGNVSIGDGATLLPGTVLTKSIPAGVVMRGNPAQLVMRILKMSS